MLYIKCYDDLPTNPNATYEVLDEDAISKKFGFSLISKPIVSIKESCQLKVFYGHLKETFEKHIRTNNKISVSEYVVFTDEQVNQLTLNVAEHCVIALHSKQDGSKLGHGLFAGKKIPKGFIIPYPGEILFKPTNIPGNGYESCIGDCVIQNSLTGKHALVNDPGKCGGLARFVQYAWGNKEIAERITFEKPVPNLAVSNLIPRKAFLIDESNNPISEFIYLETTAEIDVGDMLCWDYFESFITALLYFKDAGVYPELFTTTGQIIPAKNYYYNLYLLPHHVTLDVKNETHDTEWIPYKSLVNIISKDQQLVRKVEFHADSVKIIMYTIKNEYNNSWQPRRGFFLGKAEKQEYLLTTKDLQDCETLVQFTYKKLYPTQSIPFFKLAFGNDCIRCLFPTCSKQEKINLLSALQELSSCYGDNWGISDKISSYNGDIIDTKQQQLVGDPIGCVQSIFLILDMQTNPTKIHERLAQQTSTKPVTTIVTPQDKDQHKASSSSSLFLSSGFAKGFLLSNNKVKLKSEEKPSASYQMDLMNNATSTAKLTPKI